MNCAYITGEDWEDFRKEHGLAHDWLLGRCLTNELFMLRAELGIGHSSPGRIQWMKDRVAELAKVLEVPA